jgi:TonB family protein
MDPLTEDELSGILRKLESSPAPASLDARVMGAALACFRRDPWWRRAVSCSVRIPVPVLGLFVLAFCTLGAFAFRTNHPISIAQGNAVRLSAERPRRIDDRTLTVPPGRADRNLLISPEPVYPDRAKASGAEGIVKLEVRINAQGRVSNTRAISGDTSLIPAAISAVKRRIYRPTLLNGVPIAVVTDVDVTFRLDVAITPRPTQ